MPHPRYLLPLLLPWLATANPLPENVDLTAGKGSVAHANHIFNSIHSSMRQFGSSLNHNGMSLFVATVPEGTELYHGTSREYRVNGTEWLAFEPEHALIFARPRGPPPGRGRPGRGPPGEGPPSEGHDSYGPPPPRIDDNDGGRNRPHESHKGDKHRGGKDSPSKGRPEQHHDGIDRSCKHGDRPDKHHGPPRNGSHPDVPTHQPPPSDGRHPPPSCDGRHQSSPSDVRRPPSGGCHPPPSSDDRRLPQPFEGRPPPPSQDLPPSDGRTPFPPHHGPPREGFDQDFWHPGSAYEECKHRGPPREDFDHHGPPHRGSEPFRQGLTGGFGGLPSHDLKKAMERHHHDEHERRGPLSLPPVGFWVRRLGDMLRNPKRNASPPSPPEYVPQSKARVARDASGALISQQEPLEEDRNDQPEQSRTGYLHTYRTKHNLRLLYLDGQSAAKSQKGTLDTQDILLLNGAIDHNSGMFGEKERADKMCELAHKQWGDRIDGILRMEGGFEIILCSFATHLDVVSIATTISKAGGGPGGNDEENFNYYRAVAARYHGIGGGRVVLDYDRLVTAFAHPDAIFFDNTSRPRLNNESVDLDVIRQNVNNMALRQGDDVSFNWQSVVDMIVERYAERIEYLASGKLKTLSALRDEIDRALRPFIDYSARDSDREIERCASHFLPVYVDTTTVAARAVQQVSRSLCAGLVASSSLESYEDTLDSLQHLQQYLGWTTWKQCRGCEMHEICFLPIWPIGSAEDFDQPKCRSDASWTPGHGNYWNDFGGPGGPGGPRHGQGEQFPPDKPEGERLLSSSATL